MAESVVEDDRQDLILKDDCLEAGLPKGRSQTRSNISHMSGEAENVVIYSTWAASLPLDWASMSSSGSLVVFPDFPR